MLTSGKGVFVFSFQGLELFSLVEGIIKDLGSILHKQTFLKRWIQANVYQNPRIPGDSDTFFREQSIKVVLKKWNLIKSGIK